MRYDPYKNPCTKSYTEVCLHSNLQCRVQEIIADVLDHDNVQKVLTLEEQVSPKAHNSLAEDTAVCCQQHSPGSHMA